MIKNPLTNEECVQLALSCWYLTGATASGKTALSLELAETLDAEIISLDSMSIYRGMDVGTAKASVSERQRVPHHLIDICDPVDSFSVSRYRSLSINAIQEIRERGKQIIFVGGTALYLKALLRGIFDGPAANWEFRNEIENELENVGIEELYKRLEQVDPLSAHKLHRNDKRRIIRALEVFTTTGQPISHLQNEFESGHSSDQCKVFTLRHDRTILHERIQRRVDWMFDNDFVGEVRRLQEQWGELSQTAAQAVGYREVIEHLDGKQDLEMTKDRVLSRTRRFARHQETWFRGLSECRILDLPGGYESEFDDIRRLADEIVRLGSSRN